MASAVIAIGDELLAGFTLDTNSHWLAQQLRLLGFPLKRVTVVRDRQDEIVEQVRRDLCDPEVEDVFCSGGLGPTPDDRTYEAIAAALGREMVTWQPVLERIERRVRRMHEAGLIESSQVTEGNRRMARIPAGPDHVFRNRRGMAPGLMYRVDGRRVFVLPGVPGELRSIFAEELAPEFLTGRTAGVVRELRFLFAAESRFYPVLHELETSHPDVSVGSYPNFQTRELVLRFTGEDERRVLDAEEIVRTRAAALGLQPMD
ncbi:MAG TPA: molybdopterin-binding protein [Candidatus Eisenbacteria bacterium]|nr:molybdopterin-binding protein [Candidatus Eisenbacteria bacterium]